ncbi:type 1 glutamine amidotransferase [Mesorhizobium sp. YM1C-6-2]|uniref:type 1 glutamine amidotransferase n=1 Tax=Mesorhizobium sp. YM1C-6-2 TaxID=1827501 RepID=UPI000EF27805|nr:type 1 glutamine amidotransferase [Mesorhizobium sp. YM1C-6-2]RLP22994.1 type 1 glutamine amidotransferase [Mesorhizobium sp. YM1C-6-2]
MRVLIVQNFDNTGPGQVETALVEAGAELDLRQAYRGDALPANAAGHDAMLVLGGAQSALDDDDHPYLPPLLSLIRDFADSGRSVLGICLGCQLLARAYGGKNLLGAAPEFGWRGVTRTREGAADPMLGAVPDAFTSFQWHDDTFTLPPGAVRLATSPAAENQAFRLGRAAYGIQFHFEADRSIVRQWTSMYPERVAERDPSWRYDVEAAAHGAAADATGLTLARAWVATIPQRAAALQATA